MTSGSDSREHKLTTDRSGFGTSVIKLLMSSVTAQLIVLASAPLISRLYSPDAIGLFGVFVGISSMIAMVGTLRFEMAIVVARGVQEAQYLFWATLIATSWLCITIGAVFFVAPELSAWFDLSSTFSAFLWMLPLSSFIHVATLGTIRIAGKCDAFGRLAIASFAGRVTDVTVKILLAFVYDFGWAGLIWGTIIGEAVTVLLVLLTLRNWDWKPPRSIRNYAKVLKRYQRFPVFNLPAALCSGLTDAIPLILFAIIFDPYTAGMLELSRRVLGRPSSMLGNQFYTVFYQKSREAFVHKGTIAPIIERALPTLALLVLGPFLVVGLWGAPLFSFVFGAEWTEAGSYAAILAPAWFLRAVSGPIRVFNTLQHQAIDLSWQLFHLALTLLALGIGCLVGGPREVVICLSMGMMLAFIVHLSLNIRLSGASLSKMGTWTLSLIRQRKPAV
jgi:O-antigen/teichoic acid export membrane protein